MVTLGVLCAQGAKHKNVCMCMRVCVRWSVCELQERCMVGGQMEAKFDSQQVNLRG